MRAVSFDIVRFAGERKLRSLRLPRGFANMKALTSATDPAAAVDSFIVAVPAV
jgi:hypothetical protein